MTSERTPLFDFGHQPIAHRLLAAADAAEFTHSLSLSMCNDTGVVHIDDPIAPEELYSNYFCLSDWKSQPHISRIADLAAGIPGLGSDSSIIEVGSNDGRFLQTLRERGLKNVVGIEPAQDACQSAKQKGVETISGYFTAESARQLVAQRGQFDLFISRQVLEHVGDLEDHRRAIQTVLKPGGHVLIELPDFSFSLTTADYSAIWEEHCNYFTLESLTQYVAAAKIRVTHSETINFSGQALVIVGTETGEAVPNQGGHLADLRRRVLAYRDYWPQFRGEFTGLLEGERAAGRKVAIYGAGCRACSLINFTGTAEYIDCVVDDQPEKQGKFMPGSRLPIFPSTALRDRKIDTCLLAVNSENDEKVLSRHATAASAGLKFLPILPPSDELPEFWSYNRAA